MSVMVEPKEQKTDGGQLGWCWGVGCLKVSHGSA